MKKYSTNDFERDFPTNDACLDWLFEARWPKKVKKCDKCGRVARHYRIEGRACYSCEFCGNHVYPMAGTIFEDTKFDHLKLWFKAVAYMSVTRCGISSRQLSRDIGVTVKTGYRMWKQIRSVLKESARLTGPVEADEAYFGGKAQNMHASKRAKLGGRGTAGKTPVFGLVERGGKVVAINVPAVDGATLLPEIDKHVLPTSTVYTDEMGAYKYLGEHGYDHQVIAHADGVYVNGKIHTNTIEGFWSQLKRSIDGTYHHVTPKHLQEYVDEYSFRYSHRNDEQPMFATMLAQVVHHASERTSATWRPSLGR